MSVSVRIADRKDLEDMLRIERETMPNHTYLFETQEELLDRYKGDMLLAFKDDEHVGIGHLYAQPDGNGWFEILRVTLEKQKNGAGTALWD